MNNWMYLWIVYFDLSLIYICILDQTVFKNHIVDNEYVFKENYKIKSYIYDKMS